MTAKWLHEVIGVGAAVVLATVSMSVLISCSEDDRTAANPLVAKIAQTDHRSVRIDIRNASARPVRIHLELVGAVYPIPNGLLRVSTDEGRLSFVAPTVERTAGTEHRIDAGQSLVVSIDVCKHYDVPTDVETRLEYSTAIEIDGRFIDVRSSADGLRFRCQPQQG